MNLLGNGNCGNSWGSSNSENSWGSSGWGKSWGKSGWVGRSSSGNTKVAEGHYRSDCIASCSGWERNVWKSSHFQSYCSGCNHASAAAPWGERRKNGFVHGAKMSVWG
ncbi:hypothetical protein DPMN_174592 [Dreissena polymorpha]|uniref:Uncharacterized protein n=1 Tax=Dreissena polymorpha TaxID=45954 RepID=A0A9D4E6M6_DREPO|nr:hypothetical protein DPMN_174592 [Dreissena polymorpha]